MGAQTVATAKSPSKTRNENDEKWSSERARPRAQQRSQTRIFRTHQPIIWSAAASEARRRTPNGGTRKMRLDRSRARFLSCQRIHRGNPKLFPHSLPIISVRKEFPNCTEECFGCFRMDPMPRVGDFAMFNSGKELLDRGQIFVADII